MTRTVGEGFKKFIVTHLVNFALPIRTARDAGTRGGGKRAVAPLLPSLAKAFRVQAIRKRE